MTTTRERLRALADEQMGERDPIAHALALAAYRMAIEDAETLCLAHKPLPISKERWLGMSDEMRQIITDEERGERIAAEALAAAVRALADALK